MFIISSIFKRHCSVEVLQKLGHQLPRTAYLFKIWANSIMMRQTNPPSYCKKVQFYSTLKHSVIVDLCADIDVDKMKENYSVYSSVSLATAVQSEIDLRLDKAIQRFTDSETRVLKILQLEHDFLFSEGYAIPSSECLSSKNWLEAMTLSSMEERLLYYCNIQRLRKTVKQEATDRDGLQSSKSVSQGENCYSIFLDVLHPEHEERVANHRLVSAMLHGCCLVVDMKFDENHLSSEIDPLVSQLWKLYLTNRSHQEPFHLVFTNCQKSRSAYWQFHLTCKMKASFTLATFTEKSYIDIFPREDMVYLSAQSKESMLVFNSRRVYILGAYYDPLVHKKLSYMKAKEDNITCLKLPIDHHVRWARQASKDLDLDRVVGVLLSVKSNGNWKEAFISSVPNLVNQQV